MRIRDSNKGKYLRVWEPVTACVPRKDSQCGPAEYACAQDKRNGKAQQLCCGGDRNRAGGPLRTRLLLVLFGFLDRSVRFYGQSGIYPLNPGDRQETSDH